MLLAALITRYWKKHIDEADVEVDGKNLFKRLKWKLLYCYLYLTARVNGYDNPWSKPFINRCMLYFEEEK